MGGIRFMTEKDTLQETVATLISRRVEGAYWDFKRCHHKDKADLIHDTLCLANAKHQGRRFLIFGVDDKNFSLHSIDSATRRRAQADIAGLFRDNAKKFFQSRFPELYLTAVSIDGALIDVLVVEDTSHKPYYLIESYGKICAHHIYTRVCDTNTPMKDAAQPHEIERMWRERFGLDMPPLDRVKCYLSNFDAWAPSHRTEQNMYWHHQTFPEFTLQVTEAEDFMARHEEWTRGEIQTDNNHAGYYEIYYHQTCLARVRYVNFDDHKKSMVAPTWEAVKAGRFYFYEADSVSYAVQKFHSFYVKEDHSTTLSIRGGGESSKQARLRWGHQLTIPVLYTGELDGFLGPRRDGDFVKASSDEVEQYEMFILHLLEFENWRKQQGRALRERRAAPAPTR